MALTKAEKKELKRLIDSDQAIPERYRIALFPEGGPTDAALRDPLGSPLAAERLSELNAQLEEEIEERARAEEMLRESEKRYRLLAENIPGVVYLCNNDERWTMLYLSDSVEELTGYPKEEFLVDRLSFADLYHPDDMPGVYADVEAALAKGAPFHLRYRIKHKDGSWRWIEETGGGVTGPDGTELIEGHLTDRTETAKAETALRESEQFLRAVLDSSPIGVSVRSATGRLLSYNAAWQYIWNISNEDIATDLQTERQDLELDGRYAYSKPWWDELKRLYQEGGTLVIPEVETGRVYAGAPQWISQIFYAIPDETGAVDRVVVLTMDITERKQTEAALHESEARYQAFVNTSNDLIFIKDSQGRYVVANQATLEFFGKSQEELLGCTDYELMDAAGADYCASSDRQAMEQQQPVVSEEAIGAKVFETTKFPVPLGEGQGIGAIIRDVTDRKQAGSALRESEQFLRAVLDNSPIGVSVRSNTGKLLSYNPAWQKIWAIPDEDIKLDTEKERGELKLDERDAYSVPYWDELRRVYEQGGMLVIPEIRTTGRRPGVAEWVSQIFYAIPDATGGVDRVVVITQDITERKAVEEELRESEERFRTVVENMLDPLVIIDCQGIVQFANPAAKQISQIPDDVELVGKPFQQFYDPEFLEKAQETFERIMEVGEAITSEYQIRTVNGEIKLVEAHGSRVIQQGEPMVLITARDITERKAAEQALAEEHDLLQNLMDGVEDMVYFKDAQSRFVRINHAQARFLGVDGPEEALGNSDFDYFPEKEAAWRREDEQRIMQTGQAQLGDLERIERPDGRVMWYSVTKMPRNDAAGNTIGTFGCSRDVTEIMQAREALRESAQMLRAVLEASPLAITLNDKYGRLLSYNRAWQEMWGFTDEYIEENFQQELSELEFNLTDEYVKPWWDDIRRVFTEGGRLFIPEADRRPYYPGPVEFVSQHLYAIQDEHGEVEQVVIITSDITDRKRAVQQLNDSARFLRTLIDTAPIGISVHDRYGNKLSYNKVWQEIWGFTDEYIQQHFQQNATKLEFDHTDEYVKPYWDEIREIFEKGGTLCIEELDIRPHYPGPAEFVSQFLYSVPDERGDVDRVVVITQDISERKRTECELAESKQRLELALEGAADGVWDCDYTTGTMYRSSQVIDGLGYPEGLAEDADAWIDLIHPDDREHVLQAWQSHIDGLTEQYSAEQRLRKADGSYIWVLDSGKVVERDQDGNPTRLSGTHKDITQLKLVEEELRRARERYHSFIRQSHESTFCIEFKEQIETSWDAEEQARAIVRSGYLHECNQATADMYQVPSPEHLIGKTYEYFQSLNTNEPDPNVFRRFIAAGYHVAGVETQRDSGLGHPRYFTCSYIGIVEDGCLARIWGTEIEITETKLAELSLRASEQRYRDLVEQTQVPIAVLQDFRAVYTNQATARLLGFDSYQDLFGMKLPDVVSPEFRSQLNMSYAALIQQTASVIELTVSLLAKDGSRIWVDVVAERIEYEGQPAVQVSLRDITDRKLAEDALKASETHLRTLLDTNPDFVWLKDPQGVYLNCNPRFETMYGARESEIIGKRDYDFVPKEQADFFRKMDLAAIAADGPSMNEEVVTLADGSLVDLETIKTPLKDENGNVIGVLGIGRDITERKQAEEALRNSEMKHATAVEIAQLGPWELDEDSQTFTFTDAFYSLYRTTAEREGGYQMPFEEYGRRFHHPEDVGLLAEENQRALATEDPSISRKLEHRVVFGDGQVGYVAVTYYAIKDETGRVVKTFGVNQDVTERRMREAANEACLRINACATKHNTAELLTMAIDEGEALTSSKIGFFHFFDDNSNELWQQAWSSQTTASMCKAESFPSHYQLSEAGVWADCVEERRPVFHNDYASLPHKKGLPEGHAPITRELLVPVIRNDKVVAILGVGNKPCDYNAHDASVLQQLADLAWDLAAIQRVETALKESEENFRNFFETMNDVIIVGTSEGKILYTNPAASDLLGYSTSEFSTMHILDVNPASQRKEAEQIFADIFQGVRSVCPLPLVTKAGRLIPVETRVWFGKWDGQDCVFGMCRDLSAEQEAQQRFERIFRRSPALMALNDTADGKFIDVNDAWLETLGYTREEVVGFSAAELGVIMEPHSQAAAKSKLENEGSISNVELKARRKDGGIVHGVFFGETITSQGKQYHLTVMLDITDRKQAEERLEQERRLFIGGPTVVFKWRTDYGRSIEYVSPNVLNQFGYTPEELLSPEFEFTSIIHPDDYENKRPIVEEHLAKHDESFQVEYRIACKDGSYRYVSDFTVVNRNGDGTVKDIQGYIVDITERQQAQEELRRSEKFLDSVIENLPAMVFVKNAADLRFVRLNKAGEELLGYPREELLGKNDYDFFPKEEADFFTQKDREVLESHGVLDIPDEKIDTKHQGQRILHTCKIPILDEAGNAEFLLGISYDVTEGKQTQEALRQRESYLSSIIENQPGLVWLKDKECRFLAVNRTFANACGLDSPEALVGKTDFDIWPHDLAESYVADDRKVLEEARPKAVEEPIDDQGVRRWFETFKAPVFGEHGEVIGTTGYAHDITERKLADEALRASEERYRGIFDESVATIYVFDTEKRFVDSNQAGLDLLGYSREELMRLSIPDVDADPVVVLSAHGELLEGGRLVNYEHKLRRKDGSVITVLNNSRPLTDAEGNIVGMQSTLLDITDRKVAEEALHQEEERYRLLAESAHEAIGLFDTDGRLMYANSAAMDLFGYTADEAARITLEQLAPPDELPSWLELIESRRAGNMEVVSFSSEVLGKDGHRIPLDVNNVPIIQDGEVRGLLNICRDATERLKAEQAETRLRQVQKMEALGTLAGGIAHDFNNMLFAIMGNAELIRDYLAAGSPATEYMVRLMGSANRAKELVQQILAFSRQTQPEQVNVDLAVLVKEIYKLLRATLPPSINVKLSLEKLRCSVSADPTELHQVVMNLVTNAAQAIGEEPGRIEISVDECEITGDEDLPHEVKPGRYVEMRVADTGHGIAPENAARIFEPFFTTKEVGQGTGMGLAVVHGIVSKLGGAVFVESEAGHGTCFTVLLPAQQESAGHESLLSEAPQPGAGRVLVVEDEEEVRRVIVRMLESLNYEYVEFAAAMPALAYLNEHAGEIDVVFSDQAMPGMTGAQLTAVVKQRWPQLPVILCTGYITSMSAETAHRTGAATLLYKPVLMRDLAETLQEVLKDKR